MNQSGIRKFELDWQVTSVTDLKKKLLIETANAILKDQNYYHLTWPGLYMFLSNDNRVLYDGSATRSKGSALRTRLREHFKGQTDFSLRLRKSKLEIDTLKVAVAAVTDETISAEILKIERALIHSLSPPGNIENCLIINRGCSDILPD